MGTRTCRGVAASTARDASWYRPREPFFATLNLVESGQRTVPERSRASRLLTDPARFDPTSIKRMQGSFVAAQFFVDGEPFFLITLNLMARASFPTTLSQSVTERPNCFLLL